MSSIKQLAKDWLPPAVIQMAKSIREDSTKFEGNYSTWQEATSCCQGYDADSILVKVLNATLKVKRGEAVFERDSILFDHHEFDWPLLAGLMWAAAKDIRGLDVLDFGGALGSSYFQNRTFLSSLPKVSWSVIEQEHFVRAGSEHIQNEILKFYPSIDDCLLKNKPNVVLLSSVLQYLPEPRAVIKEILKVQAQIILLDKTIVNQTQSDSIYIQKVPKSIYEASYPCRSLSEEKLIASFLPNYGLISKFPSLVFPALNQIDSEFSGYIFSKVAK